MLLLTGFLVFLLLVIPTAAAAANSPLHRVDADRFGHRQMVDITAFNGPHVLRYLQVTRRYRWMGISAGLTTGVFSATSGSMFLAPYFVLIGWLLGVMAGEIAFGRPRGPIRRAPGIRLVPPKLAATWLICAAFSCGVALSTVERSLSAETTVDHRLGAAAVFGVVAVVQFMAGGLHRRALLSGTADLVGGELATRSHSARWLLGVGASAALWTSVIALPIRWFHGMGVPALIGLPILALALASNAWPPGTSGTSGTFGKRTIWFWAAAGVALAGVSLPANLDGAVFGRIQ